MLSGLWIQLFQYTQTGGNAPVKTDVKKSQNHRPRYSRGIIAEALRRPAA